MDGVMQKLTSYVSNNPTTILLVIVVMVIFIVYLYIKSLNCIPLFSIKKQDNLKINKKKKNKKNNKDDDSDDENSIPSTTVVLSEPEIKKNTTDPVVTKLVNDINQTS